MALIKEAVSEEMWNLLQRLMADESLKDFLLVGGTALSLRLGHRLSIDIDLFTKNNFDADVMHKYLQTEYGAKDSVVFENTVMTYIQNIKVDLLAHKYPLVQPMETDDNIRLISNQDIGAMKLHAIFQSGERLKDFIDMYFLLEKNSLSTYLKSYETKYKCNPSLAAHSLIYFDGIRKEYEISMTKGKENNWTKMQERLTKAVKFPNLKFADSLQQVGIYNKKGKGFRR